jgi:hypothetical protein
MLPAHRAADGVTRCARSGQRIQVDLTPAEWRARLDAAVREARLGTEVSSTDLMLTAIDDYMTSPLTLRKTGLPVLLVRAMHCPSGVQ